MGQRRGHGPLPPCRQAPHPHRRSRTHRGPRGARGRRRRRRRHRGCRPGTRVRNLGRSRQGGHHAVRAHRAQAQLAGVGQRAARHGRLHLHHRRSGPRAPDPARALPGVPGRRLRLRRSERLPPGRGAQTHRHRHARGRHGAEPVHDDHVALRGTGPRAARQRLLLRRADQPVPLRGRVGVHQHRAGFLGCVRRVPRPAGARPRRALRDQRVAAGPPRRAARHHRRSGRADDARRHSASHGGIPHPHRHRADPRRRARRPPPGDARLLADRATW